MSIPQQFRDLPDPVHKFDALLRVALASLLPDLAAAPWYVREREVVNLFVFRHLIPQFQTENLDIGQLGIEVPVLKIRESPKAKLGKSADILVWSHSKATIWQRCKPLVHVEWKNISCRENNPDELKRQYKRDIRYLHNNRRSVCVSYAVLTDQRDRCVDLCCKRIVDGREPENFFSEPLKCAATCPESAITDLQFRSSELLLRSQACPDCIAHSSAALVPTALA